MELNLKQCMKREAFFSSLGTEINGYLEVLNESDSKISWLPVNLLKPSGDN